MIGNLPPDVKKIYKTTYSGKANELLRLAVVVRDAHDAITMQDLKGRTLAWNPAATRIYGWSETEALLMNVRDRIPNAALAREVAAMTQLSQAQILAPYLTERIDKQGVVIPVTITSTALLNDAGEIYAIATTERLVDKPSA